MAGSVLARYGSAEGLPRVWASPSFSRSISHTCLIAGGPDGTGVAVAAPVVVSEPAKAQAAATATAAARPGRRAAAAPRNRDIRAMECSFVPGGQLAPPAWVSAAGDGRRPDEYPGPAG